MKLISRQIMDVPIDKVTGIDSAFGRMMKININDVPKKFRDIYSRSRDDAYNNFSIKTVFESYEIVEIANSKIILEKEMVIENQLLSEILSDSSQLLFCVASLNGYEALNEGDNDMVYKLFLDSWGTAFIEMAYKWVKNMISEDLSKNKLYTSHSFSPGQNNIPMDIQKTIFKHLEPKEIDVALNDSCMMHPKKSISGIVGIASCNNSGARPCDICERRDTCDWAYA